MSEDFERLREWVGRKETRTDVVTRWPITALAATLEDTRVSCDEGSPVPPGWHWIFFLEAKPPSELGPYGHPKRGGFLPPVPLPRGMWVGGRLDLVQPLTIGEGDPVPGGGGSAAERPLDAQRPSRFGDVLSLFRADLQRTSHPL